MNMTEKNGQPSMEEILASIRRIIAEEPGPQNTELRGTPIMLKGDGVLEDTGDFDLPAIFRSSPPATSERPAPLLGRLTDAIRSATAAQPEGRSVFGGDDHARAEAVELASAGAEANGSYPALSSLRSVRPVEPGPTEPLRPVAQPQHAVETPPSNVSNAAPVTASSGPPGEAPKRVMVPFKDTHFLRMSAPTGAQPAPSAAAAPEPIPAAAPAPLPPEPAPPVDFGAIIPGQFDRSGIVNGTPVNEAAVNGAAYHPAPFAGLTEAPPAAAAPVAVPPPPLPAQAPANHALTVAPPMGDQPQGEAAGTIEDTTADLLRPMLRQWLADNMPRMVEKALHIEIAESVKAPKKP
jgi:cell pole-organizing protein PopZ